MNTVAASAVAFSAGVVSFASPCVLPLVPTYLAVIATAVPKPAATGSSSPPERGRAVRATLMFTAGFTAVFCALGASASTLGSLVSEHRAVLQTVSGAAVVVFGVLALLSARVGLFAMVRDRRHWPQLQRWGRAGPPVLGVAFALGWSPCIGPVLGSVLALAATRGHALAGSSLLAVYALGLALPLLACSMLLDRTEAVTRALGRRTRHLGVAAGLALVGVGALLLSGELNTVARVAS